MTVSNTNTWRHIPLSQCGEWLSGGTPSKSKSEYWGGDIPWISAKSLHDFYIRDSEDKVTELGAQNGTRLVPANTILFVVRGMSLANEFRIGITKREVTFNQDIKAIIHHDGFDPLFLAYAIRAKSARILGIVDEASHGTRRLSTDQISKVIIPLPPLPIQHRIADILGALDDKIELNRKMNRTLEAMAQALYKHWFVDGEYGETRGLLDLVDLNPRLSIPKGRKATYVDMKGIPTNGMSVEQVDVREYKSGSKFQNNDTLLARITPCLENGKTAFVDFLQDGEVGFGSTEFIVMRPKEGTSPQFVYCLARDPSFRSFAIQSMSGTSGRQRVQIDTLTLFQIETFDGSKMQQFHEMTQPWFAQVRANTQQIGALAEARDYLLPKLLSGEIEVEMAEERLEDAL